MTDINKNDLPIVENPTITPPIENSGSDKGLSTEIEGQLDEKTKAGFQRLIAKKDEKISELSGLLTTANERLYDYEKAENDRKFAEMSETEKLQTQLEEERTKRVRLELNSFVKAEMTKRNLMEIPLAEDIIETPWLLKAVKVNLSSNPTWDETLETVKTYLPSYLDTLVVPAGDVTPTITPPPADNPEITPSMPPERDNPTPSTNSQTKIWTKVEIDRIKSNNEEWMKHRDEITTAYNEGRVI